MKYMIADVVSVLVMSPSMRREWIEISYIGRILSGGNVSLHAEGVD